MIPDDITKSTINTRDGPTSSRPWIVFWSKDYLNDRALRICRGLVVAAELTIMPPVLSGGNASKGLDSPSFTTRLEAKKQRAQRIPEWDEKAGPSPVGEGRRLNCIS
jgi:hypothetical protein